MADIMQEIPDDLGFDIDGLEVINIDIDSINSESLSSAKDMLSNLTKFYCDEEFMKNNPTFKKHIGTMLDSLKTSYKMLMVDGEIQDVLVKSISNNSNNASLYRALTELQKTILTINKQIDEKVESINKFMKDYKEKKEIEGSSMILENKNPEEENNVVDISATYRGSRDFIKSQKDQMALE